MGRLQIILVRQGACQYVAAAFFVALIAFAVSASGADGFQEVNDSAAAQALPLTPLVIESRDGRKLSFRVGVARSKFELQHGLKYRLSMPADEGMLFDFAREMRVGMWMKNTYISLDMIFIDGDGIIVDIAKSTTPQSEEPIAPDREVLAILEINGGLSDRFGIRIGDRVVHEVVAGSLEQ